jgi:hypothetical protein
MDIQNQVEFLKSRGYDVTELQAAVDAGDLELARTLLWQISEAHREEHPPPTPSAPV